ncbi:hypothetical protein C823_007223 [Eubacterium plexicaudatum ASF492]|uniref:Uncharacterized protein n=1 Tax=Eubacterium plexicaudatum ASF492 TaxID=1235802 RepID=N2AMS5_9FIRM|nr:hypothetical protein C823_007223 [Eubacterium plexicaudatum ASF492]
MKAFQLTEQKEFMNLLLRSDIFDNFLLSEASVHTAVKYEIDGRLNPSFFSDEERSDQQLDDLSHMPYGRLRPIFFELIKGRTAPTSFQFVLMLSPSNLKNTLHASGTAISPSDILGVYLNILYQNETLMLTTGVSYRVFIPDNSFEREWEKFTINFLKRNNIVFSEI